MPQQTNLNVSPYFDDFDAQNDYYKVLFKPGYPVQARELTSLQSILQNQIEKFGQHFFKEGAAVIPGNTNYNGQYYAIQLQNNYQGVPVSAYVDQLVGTRITGERSGVSAFVDKILYPEDSDRGNLTLYINYLNAGSVDNTTREFLDGETLVCSEQISSGLLGNSVIPAGSPFASTIDIDAAANGSSFDIAEGVYFIRGAFVNVSAETLILDQYSNGPSYRVGLFITEEIVTSDIDEDLNDNSQGFSNYSAPGADRLRITASLFKKPLTDFNDDNFVHLATIENGLMVNRSKNGFAVGDSGKVFYKDLDEVLARRTSEESGDYYVKPFTIRALDSLNDHLGNRGLYEEGQTTPTGGVVSDDLGIYKLSPGKAYVKGFAVETVGSTIIDFDKPRTTRTLEGQNLIYNTGPTLTLNRVFRSPTVGFGNTYFVSLRDQRVGSTQDPVTHPGKEVGVARVYDFRLESGSYDTSNANLNQWNLCLYDVQTTTDISLNQAINLSIPTHVKGANSGAVGFLRHEVSAGTAVTVYGTNGSFIPNERLIFNGIDDGRIAIAVTAHGISDAKSVFGGGGNTGINTFSADIIPSTSFFAGIATVSAASNGNSTIVSKNPKFPGTIVKENDLVEFTDTTSSTDDPTLARVTGVTANSIVVEGVESVPGIAAGALPSNLITITDLKVLKTKFSSSSDDTLFTPLPKDNIASVSLEDASLTIRKTFTVNISANQLSGNGVTADTNETFLPFDEERYLLTRSDGTTEALTSDMINISSDGTNLQIVNLGSNDTGSTLVASLTKIKPKSKVKIKNRSNSIIIDKSKLEGSGIGATTLNNGLVYGNYPYGTRVEDEEISLNVPDIVEIHGIFESSGTADPSAPSLILQTINSQSTTTAEVLIGEQLVGQTSGSVAVAVEIASSNTVKYALKNAIGFTEGETVEFKESGVTAVISGNTSSDRDVSSNFTFKSGQENTFYNYGILKRKPNSAEPSKKVKVYFSNAYFDPTDDGDITTVESYKQFDYNRDIKIVDGNRTTDIIDIRPRVSNYTVSQNVRSPLEFFGRSFDGAGQSATNVLASDEAIRLGYSYYQGRIDRIYLTKRGTFQVIYGTPSDSPQRPNPIEDAIEIAQVSLPPYLYDPKTADIKFLEYKRYQMRDIKKLEDRIRNLEYYTSLSLLEVETANLFVEDDEGLNRFKSGFFVDNFTDFKVQDTLLPINNSIDRKSKVLRPRHYTTALDLSFGPVIGDTSNEDVNFNTIEGTNVRKQNGILTLDYAERELLKQTFGTRSESVTPFLKSFWKGTLEMVPASDVWVDTVRLEPQIIGVEGDYARTFDDLVESGDIDPQTGFGPIIWDSWEQNWTGSSFVDRDRRRSETHILGHWRHRRTDVIEETLRTTTRTGTRTRDGRQTAVFEQFDQSTVGDRTVSRDLIPYMRSRNIEFTAKQVLPLATMYAFFDGVDVTKYCIPKLLEISMVSGTFQVGETIEGVTIRTGQGGNQVSTEESDPSIRFRVAQLNHKEGAFDAPTKTYVENPYTNQPIGGTYSSTSTLLNIDTAALAEQARGDFFGWVGTGMALRGTTSGATATITGVRLISDRAATLIGSFFIPNPNNSSFPSFESGTKTLTFVNDPNNNQRTSTTVAEEEFNSSGTIESKQETVLSVRNARVDVQIVSETEPIRSVDTAIIESRVVNSWTWWVPPPPPPPPPPAPPPRPRRRRGDPLAQSFYVSEDTGAFLTSCDLFFSSKDDMDIPVTCQIRPMEGGHPSQKILPFSEVVLDPDEISTSADGSIATNIPFKAPVYVEGGNEYCIVLLSNSTKYQVFISRVGENDLVSDDFVATQPTLGSLFKSQNAFTWEPSQWEDLKYTLYRAEFETTGNVELYNPELSEGNSQIPKLMPDPLEIESRTIRVGLGTTVADSYEIGNTFSQLGTNATGNLVGTAGSATGTLTVSNAGIGYTPGNGSFTFNGVNLITLTGSGRGATANVSIQDGSVSSSPTIVTGGFGYKVGDVLGIGTIGSSSAGTNARLTITNIGDANELIISDVQGEFIVGAANTLMYTNSSGITTELNYSNGGDTQISTINVNSDGLHFNVNHKNHGMYFADNSVILSNVTPDTIPTTITTEYSVDSTNGITVADSSSFETFEGVGIGTTNTGYVLIGNEVIEYTNVTGNTIGGNIVRGTNARTYPIGTPISKYELAGVNLKRINKTHSLSDVTDTNPSTFDSYKVKIDTSEKFNDSNEDRSVDTSYPKLYFNETKTSGGFKVRATQNIPFEVITPNIQAMLVSGTSLTGSVRTVSGKSISGSEIPYAEVGFETININSANYLDTPRLIASKVNEDLKLSNIAGNKSLNMRLNLNSIDSRISPVIDTQRMSAVLTSNRVNDVISDYASDSRVKTVFGDPTACQYISNEVVLENPASSIKILLSGHIDETSDIRAFYSVSENVGDEPIFTPFPGYKNLNRFGEVINEENSDGRPDTLVAKSNTNSFSESNTEYKDYTFTIDNLPSFKVYRIKLVLTSTDQVFVPKVRDLRVLALA